MFNDELTLIKQKTIVDDLGNQLKKNIRKKVLCKVSSVTRNEFYVSSTTGYKPQYVFLIHEFEYENEELVEYGGNTFVVLRTYAQKPDRLFNYESLSGDFLEIVVGEKIGSIS